MVITEYVKMLKNYWNTKKFNLLKHFRLLLFCVCTTQLRLQYLCSLQFKKYAAVSIFSPYLMYCNCLCWHLFANQFSSSIFELVKGHVSINMYLLLHSSQFLLMLMIHFNHILSALLHKLHILGNGLIFLADALLKWYEVVSIKLTVSVSIQT